MREQDGYVVEGFLEEISRCHVLSVQWLRSRQRRHTTICTVQNISLLDKKGNERETKEKERETDQRQFVKSSHWTNVVQGLKGDQKRE